MYHVNKKTRQQFNKQWNNSKKNCAYYFFYLLFFFIFVKEKGWIWIKSEKESGMLFEERGGGGIYIFF